MIFCQETGQKNSTFEFDVSGSQVVIDHFCFGHFVRSHSNVRVDGVLYFLLGAVVFLLNFFPSDCFLSRYNRLLHDGRTAKTGSQDLTIHRYDFSSTLKSQAFTYLFQALNKSLNLYVTLQLGLCFSDSHKKVELIPVSASLFRSIRGSP
ncbi:hypothetical protein [Gynuella sunshinyii]|uniref:hypothetical protein n=1 Tax=Gynuella sunshinyii TaxID=1445505 RepID=UPI0011862382|nr:hypothetical protein [Gynuella sunshinyii]